MITRKNLISAPQATVNTPVIAAFSSGHPKQTIQWGTSGGFPSKSSQQGAIGSPRPEVDHISLGGTMLDPC